jgi:hypothetical protein
LQAQSLLLTILLQTSAQFRVAGYTHLEFPVFAELVSHLFVSYCLQEELSVGTTAIVRDLGLEGVANAVNLDAGEVPLHSLHYVICTLSAAVSLLPLLYRAL